MKTREEKIKESLDFLCDISPGTIWTEYHWRLVLQLKQELYPLEFAFPYIYKTNIKVLNEAATLHK